MYFGVLLDSVSALQIDILILKAFFIPSQLLQMTLPPIVYLINKLLIHSQSFPKFSCPVSPQQSLITNRDGLKGIEKSII